MTDPANNYRQTRADLGYLPRSEATPQTYQNLGFKSGLEIHQQLKTDKKLFCRCPAGRFQKKDDYTPNSSVTCAPPSRSWANTTARPSWSSDQEEYPLPDQG